MLGRASKDDGPGGATTGLAGGTRSARHPSRPAHASRLQPTCAPILPIRASPRSCAAPQDDGPRQTQPLSLSVGRHVDLDVQILVHRGALPRIEHGGRGLFLDDGGALDAACPDASVSRRNTGTLSGIAGIEMTRVASRAAPADPRRGAAGSAFSMAASGMQADRRHLEIDDLDRFGLRHVAVAALVRVVKPLRELGEIVRPMRARRPARSPRRTGRDSACRRTAASAGARARNPPASGPPARPSSISRKHRVELLGRRLIERRDAGERCAPGARR